MQPADNSEKFGVDPTPRVDTKVDTKTSKVDTGVSKVAAGQLQSVVDRIEQLEEERKDIANDIRDIYTEAKGNGYVVKALRTIVRLRKISVGDRTEQEAILDTTSRPTGGQTRSFGSARWPRAGSGRRCCV